MSAQGLKTWNFNSFFARYPLEEAVSRACEMERHRVDMLQMPLLSEIYSPGWKGWQDQPAADFVEELIEWDDGNDRDHRDEPWFPNYFHCPYVWNGEVSPELFGQIELGRCASMENSVNLTSFASVNAYLDGKMELSKLINWWTFDEQTHAEMKVYSLRKHYQVTEADLFKDVDDMLTGLKNQVTREINAENIRTVNKFSALRNGPAILAGAIMLAERLNPRHNQKTREPLIRNYGYTNDELVFYNVHCYIDIFHSRIGQYLVAKYARTKEEQEIVRGYYQGQREKQRENSKEFFEKTAKFGYSKTTKTPFALADEPAKAGIDVDTA